MTVNSSDAFDTLGLNQQIVDTVQSIGYLKPTQIQQQAIPFILKNKDVMACAQTGTGKTASFILPILHKICSQNKTNNQKHSLRALVLAPTRELAAQIAENTLQYSKNLPVRSLAVFGGVSINNQIKQLRNDIDILIATPGRLLDLLHKEIIHLNDIQTIVLDEADRMLDMGFIHDIRRIINRLPKQKQSLLFSATFSKDVKKLANTFLSSPIFVDATSQNEEKKLITQYIHFVNKKDKRSLLSYLIGKNRWQQVLIFTKTKYGANNLAIQLNKDGILASVIHGNKSQGARTKALSDFKDGKITALVATDIAARGIDIQLLPHVINYDLPNIAEDYVHRIGRTGRAENSGQAISLVSHNDMEYLVSIEKLLGYKIPTIETAGYTLSPQLAQTTVDIPANKTKKPTRNKRMFNHFSK